MAFGVIDILFTSVHQNTLFANHFFLKKTVMRAPAETAPDISKILLQRTTYPLIHQIFDMETPRPVTAGPAEFPRRGSGKLSLPSFLYGNPWFRVTPSFFCL